MSSLSRLFGPSTPFRAVATVQVPDVDKDRDRGEGQRGRHEIVLRRPGLPHDQYVRLEQDRGSDDTEIPAPIRPADAPGSQERHHQPPIVQEQRKRVPPHQQHAVRMQQLRVLRVEPVREDGVDMMHPGHRMALRHLRRERQVVPERIEIEHTSIQRVLRRQRPVPEHHRDNPDHDQQPPKPPAGGWHCRCGTPDGSSGAARPRRRGGPLPDRHPPAGTPWSLPPKRTHQREPPHTAARTSQAPRRSRSTAPPPRSPRRDARGLRPRRASNAGAADMR